MLEWFKCPDGQLIPVKDCLNYPYGSCRFEERCLTYPTLAKIAEEREWTGEPSTTQLLNGTMMEFLKLTQPYVVDPDDRAFALLGTRHHEMLDEVSKSIGMLSEVAMTGEDRDILDLLIPNSYICPNCGWGEGEIQMADSPKLCPKCGKPLVIKDWTIVDLKTWGSYRVAKALGLVEVGKKPDPSGEVYKTSGRWGKAGSPKMVPVFQEVSQEADNFEAELQLNHYRILAEEKFGIKVTKLRVQATVRDGGLAVARGRGIDRNTKMIKVAILNDEDVRSYFREKRKALLLAVGQGNWSEPCNEQECWDGERCKRYCEVAMYCTKGMLHRQGG